MKRSSFRLRHPFFSGIYVALALIGGASAASSVREASAGNLNGGEPFFAPRGPTEPTVEIRETTARQEPQHPTREIETTARVPYHHQGMILSRIE